MAAGQPFYRFFLTRDIDRPVAFRVARLEGKRRSFALSEVEDDPFLPYSPLFQNRGSVTELWIVAKLFSNGKTLCAATFSPFAAQCETEEWLEFSLQYCSLPIDAELRITLYESFSPGKSLTVGNVVIPLFNKKGTLKKGRHKIPLQQPDLFVQEDKKESKEAEMFRCNKLEEIKRIEALEKKYDVHKMPHIDWLDKLAFKAIETIKQECEDFDDQDLYLTIEFPRFVKKNEAFPVVFGELSHPLFNEAHFRKPSTSASSSSSSSSSTTAPTPTYIKVFDRDDDFIDPIQLKHSQLNKMKLMDKESHPDEEEASSLSRIIAAPSTKKLSVEDKHLLRRYRYHISKNKKALTKFLRAVDWQDENDTKEAISLMWSWDPVDPVDSIEMLSKDFTSPEVRKYAVSRLAMGSDEEIISMLLQLVQALRFESDGECPLANLLIARSINNFHLASFFHWYLLCESERVKDKEPVFQKRLQLFRLEAHNFKIYPRLKKEIDLVNFLGAIQQEVSTLSIKDRKEKISWLQVHLRKIDFNNFIDTPLPLDPSKRLLRIIPEKAHIFKSAMAPLRINFETNSGEYSLIIKSGDDMRQDQLVIQMISLMDKLLKRENMDMKLTPYSVLATGSKKGLVQCISPSYSVDEVLSKYENDLQKFLRQVAPDDSGIYGIQETVFDNFVRSCAGYCVITYILGIGDRHLDNLLITPSGNLFHIDFGFILGNDPKRFPPPMKLCKEMVVAMGGAQSREYQRFIELSCEAYNILRGQSNLLLNLFNLMMEAEIPDIQREKDRTLLKITEKLRLELAPEMAIAFFQSQMNESVTALFPQITDTIHRWAQYWRS